MESTGDNPKANVQAMEKALDQEPSTLMREAQEADGLSIAEEMRMTYFGRDQTYILLIVSMGLTHEMIQEYYEHFHDEVLRSYPSPYVLEDLEVEEEIEVVTTGEKKDLAEAIEMGREGSTEATEKGARMEIIKKKLILIQEMMIHHQRKEAGAMTQETTGQDQADGQVQVLSEGRSSSS